MPVWLDKGNMLSLGSRLSQFITSEVTREFATEVSVTIMPNLVANAMGKAGVPVMMESFEQRVVPSITAGAGGIAATYKIPLVRQSGVSDFDDGRFPLVRRGNVLQMVVPEKEEEQGRETFRTIRRSVITQDEAEGLILQPLQNAFRRALDK